MKRCTKTMSGKHHFEQAFEKYIDNSTVPMERWDLKKYLECKYCGTIDDRPPKRKGTGKV